MQNTNDACKVNVNSMRNQAMAATIDIRSPNTFFALIFMLEKQMYELSVPKSFSSCLTYTLRTIHSLFSIPLACLRHK